jgi:hypothetical protein
VLTDERFQNTDIQKLVTMQLNMLKGKPDPEKFMKLYLDMEERYEPEALQDLMGFTDKHAFKMLTRGVAEGLPDEMKKEFKDRAKDASSPDQLSDIVTELMGKYGDDMRFSFMIISHEGHESIWVRVNKENLERWQGVLDHCRTRAVDINDILETMLTRQLKETSA